MKRFWSILVATVLLSISAAAQVETFEIDPLHSTTQFAVRHLGIAAVRGVFNKVSGTVQYDPSDLSKTALDVSIDAASIDTRVDIRDKDLRSSNFFDVEKYPTITFKSKRAEAQGKGKMKITGDLTMHGVTKEVVLQVEGPNGPIKDPHGNRRLGASATTQTSRKDFGVNGSPDGVADDVLITIDVEIVKHAAATVPK
jgi:polyisoprenoid-binding protein YceI